MQIVEYGMWSISNRSGESLTTDGSSWAAIVDVDAPLSKVYGKVKADFVAVTSTGSVAAFQVGCSVPVPFRPVLLSSEALPHEEDNNGILNHISPCQPK